MPFVLIVAGVVLLIAAVRDTQQYLFYLVASDFTGPNNFIYWFLSILIIGAIGYIPKMKPISDGFLILVILVLFLRKGVAGAGGGFFEQFQKQIAGTTTAKPIVSAPTGKTGASNVVSVGTGGVTITPPAVTLPGGVQIGRTGRGAL